MSEATMTSKGQVTIPKAIREATNLQTGDKLDFQIVENGSILLQARKFRVEEAYGILARDGQKPIPIEAWDRRMAAAMKRKRRWKR